MVEDFLRFMYVAFSRFESSDQVTVKFSKENIQLLAEISKVSRKLENRISPNEELSSEEFCNKVTPTYLEKVLTNVKSVTKLDYIYNNIYIYSNLPEKCNLNEYSKKDSYAAALLCYKNGYSRENKYGIRRFLIGLGYNPNKLTAMLEEVFDYIDMFNDIEKEEALKNGVTIGESMEQEIDYSKEVEIEIVEPKLLYY